MSKLRKLDTIAILSKKNKRGCENTHDFTQEKFEGINGRLI